jgi:hypothetical protein
VFEKCGSHQIFLEKDRGGLCSVELHGCRTRHPTAVARLEVRHNEDCWDVMVFESVTIISMHIDAIKC